MFLLSYISKPTIIPGVVKPVWQGCLPNWQVCRGLPSSSCPEAPLAREGRSA